MWFSSIIEDRKYRVLEESTGAFPRRNAGQRFQWGWSPVVTGRSTQFTPRVQLSVSSLGGISHKNRYSEWN